MVAHGYLVGGTVNGRWVDAKTIAPRLRGGERYRVAGGGRVLATATGNKPSVTEDVCPDTWRVRLRPSPAGGTVAVGGGWNLVPRPVRPLDPRSAVYRAAVREQVARGGVRDPRVNVTGAWRVDLEGDGVDEVVVSAVRGDLSRGIHVDAGDYSLVMVRKVVGGTVRTVLLESEFHPRASDERILNRYDVAGILDADGDGTMEIVVHGRYYEGDWATVHRLRGATGQKLATAGCGV